ncbi:acetyl-CoA acetyltransferase [Nocardia miyunensis]|uniref:acetyl-CoA acetyltransferase n=1 Tax=Nocardia miyunensis TaxID=282684 RepID=UPI00082B38DA|nr:acetyl-CoA acetyltransferase [Nocardia miyunensis]
MPDNSPESVTISPATPVLVGVGQASERLGDTGYRGLSAADLAAEAVRAALTDTTTDPTALAAALDVVAAIRAFDDSSPYATAALGAPDNVPRAIARRIGANPSRAILGPTGGQGPQQLLNELCGKIAQGRCDAALLVGAETISTVRHLASLPPAERPDFTESDTGSLEDRGYSIQGMTPFYAVRHNVVEPAVSYALLENARRARLGDSRARYAQAMGELFSPFTAVAATNPHAAAPIERDAAELVRVDERNRLITDIYPRFMVARDQVNQAAAVLVTSTETADRLGIPQSRRVYLHGYADLTERELLVRPDLDRSPAAVAAVRHALDMAAIGIDDLATMDLYSCFPIAVFNLCDGLGLDPVDPRGLTVTGGLPFFGGPGNNYTTHAIAETVARLRDRPGSYGLVSANGGVLSKHSAGVYSTTPAPWRVRPTTSLQAELNDAPGVSVAYQPNGWGTIESFVLRYGSGGSPRATVVGRLDDGRRFLAAPLDGETTSVLTDTEHPAGRRVFVRSRDAGNHVTLSREAMDAALAQHIPDLRAEYDTVSVSTSGHILEVTINRPANGNALTGDTYRELGEILTAFAHDDDLRVAVLTGAGNEAFSLGADLHGIRSPLQLMLQPHNGFDGSPLDATPAKPVIAAINGRADGDGLALALACHLSVADETATFAVPDTALGMPPGTGILLRLPHLVGRALAYDMILTGRRVDSAEALAAGLITRTAPQGKALDLAREMAADIVARSPVATRAALTFLARTETLPDAETTAPHTAVLADALVAHRDPVDGMTAYREGREPHWRNA